MWIDGKRCPSWEALGRIGKRATRAMNMLPMERQRAVIHKALDTVDIVPDKSGVAALIKAEVRYNKVIRALAADELKRTTPLDVFLERL